MGQEGIQHSLQCYNYYISVYRGFVFEMEGESQSDTFLLKADSEADMDEWITAFKKLDIVSYPKHCIPVPLF